LGGKGIKKSPPSLTGTVWRVEACYLLLEEIWHVVATFSFHYKEVKVQVWCDDFKIKALINGETILLGPFFYLARG